MKKSVCVLSVLVALSACGSSWKFWEDSDEEKAQAAMSQRRAPTLNGPVGMPQAPAGFENPMLPPMMPTDPMAQGGMPQIPPPPIDNADSMPLPPTMPPAYSPNLPPPMPEPAPSVLPNGRRAPNYNAQALGIKDIPNSSAPAVVSARPLTPAPQINSAPLPSNMPSMVPPPPPPATQ